MYQFKLNEEEDALSNLEHYSEEQLSLLNSRKRPPHEHSEHGSETQRQNQEEIKQFKRQIEERYKLSIANKIYTFPKIIKSIHDVISSEDEEDTAPFQKYSDNPFDLSNFKKKHSNKQPNDSLRQNQSRPLEQKSIETNKKIKDKQKTTDSTCKRRDQSSHQGLKHPKQQKVISMKKEKKKTERLKTEQQCSSSFVQTLRTKTDKKN